MKMDTVVAMKKYRDERLRTQRLREAAEIKALPDGERVWELLDRNISLALWKKGS